MSEQLVVFSINEEEYALPVNRVREITKLNSITPLPDCPSYIKGILNLRGKAIPVFDIHRRLGLRRSHCPLALIAEVDGTMLGLAVNSVKEVSVLDNLQPPPPMVTTPFISGIINIPGRIIMLLKLESLIGDEEQIMLGKIAG
ncbi:MAG TPA: chemotaxis protein CheW [Verrucomicrobiae bacterium]|nr:chemotaxis protein CheW [Verrucomicrobiae bacterium]